MVIKAADVAEKRAVAAEKAQALARKKIGGADNKTKLNGLGAG